MKHLKKISSIVLALIMVLAMGASVFAADTGVYTEIEDDTIKLEKEILVYNDDTSLSKVYGPGIEYTYTVSTADPAGNTVTDNDGDKMAVKEGVAGGLTVTGTAKFEKNAAVTMADGVGSTKAFVTLKANIGSFTGAGIYRYKITEEMVQADFEAAGLTRASDYDEERYVDVYIKNGTNGLEVAGIVVFIGNKSIDGKTANNNEITGKTTGFVDTYDKDINDTAETAGSGMADKYYTYNYTLTKSITGTMADKTHYFPFAIKTTGAVAGQNFTVTATETPNLVNGVADGVAATSTDINAKLKDTQTVTIKGLPANTSIEVVETNDTTDTYNVTASDASVTAKFVDNVATAAGGTQTTKVNPVSNYASNKITEPTALLTATTFVNNLNEVSPTNVVMRFAPYLFILGGAMLLLVASRRRKAEQE